jgi:anti-anti-sigma factor
MFELDREVPLTEFLDTTLSDLLTEPVLYCNEDGLIIHANPAAQLWSGTPLVGQPFVSLLQADSVVKGHRFFEEARASAANDPTVPWELTIDNETNYTIAKFRGCNDHGAVLIIAQLESEEMSQVHQEMLALTTELADVQRDLRRQNRQQQKLLDEQKQLLQTIQELTAPAVPIWDGVLLVPLVGHIDSQRAQKITDELLQRVHTNRVIYAILDMSGIAFVDTSVAQHLLETAQALRLLGVQTVLVGINPGIAESIIHLGIDLKGFLVQSDLYHAVAFVLRQLGGR